MQPFESVKQLTLPRQVECRLRELMGWQSEGTLTASERQELDLLIEARQSLAAVRARAGTALERVPPAASPVQTVRNGLPVILTPPGTPDIDPALVRRSLQEEGF